VILHLVLCVRIIWCTLGNNKQGKLKTRYAVDCLSFTVTAWWFESRQAALEGEGKHESTV
jgi:hypothetical protein